MSEEGDGEREMKRGKMTGPKARQSNTVYENECRDRTSKNETRGTMRRP